MVYKFSMATSILKKGIILGLSNEYSMHIQIFLIELVEEWKNKIKSCTSVRLRNIFQHKEDKATFKLFECFLYKNLHRSIYSISLLATRNYRNEIFSDTQKYFDVLRFMCAIMCGVLKCNLTSLFCDKRIEINICFPYVQIQFSYYFKRYK